MFPYRSCRLLVSCPGDFVSVGPAMSEARLARCSLTPSVIHTSSPPNDLPVVHRELPLTLLSTSSLPPPRSRRQSGPPDSAIPTERWPLLQPRNERRKPNLSVSSAPAGNLQSGGNALSGYCPSPKRITPSLLGHRCVNSRLPPIWRMRFWVYIRRNSESGLSVADQ
jgi:hypothetical protein